MPTLSHSLPSYESYFYLTDNQGRDVPFGTLQPGQRFYNPHEQVYLVCSEGGHYILHTLDNLFFYLGEVPDTDTEVPLQRIENRLGHFLHFTRTPDGTLTDISATGTRAQLQLRRRRDDDPQQRHWPSFIAALEAVREYRYEYL